MKTGFFPFPENHSWKKLYSDIFYRTDHNGDRIENFNLKNEYENDVFIYRPYSEECSCGYCEEFIKVYEMSHQDNCVTRSITDISLLFIYFGAGYNLLDKIIKKEAERMGFESNFEGNINELCTCDWRRNVIEWENKNNHNSKCSIVLPNFLYKRLNLEIYSRKNSVEGFIMNQRISLEEFEEMVKEILQSIQ